MKQEKRFEILHKESLGVGKSVTIIRDIHTGVQYLYNVAEYSGGLTPLLNKDGKPIIENKK